MNPSSSSPEFENEPAGFDSRDTVIVIDDSPGDTTVRPASGALLRLALAERERMARWQSLMNDPSAENPLKEDEPPKENPS